MLGGKGGQKLRRKHQREPCCKYGEQREGVERRGGVRRR